MRNRYYIPLAILLAGVAAAQDWDSEVSKKVAEIESQAAKQNAPLRVDALLDAAAQVKDTHPDLSQRLATRALAELNKDKDVPISGRIANNVIALKGAQGAAKALPSNRDRTNHYYIAIQPAPDDLARAALIRRAMADGVYELPNTISVLRRLSDSNPAAASALFDDVVKAFPWKTAKAGRYLWLLNCIGTVGAKNPTAAAGAADKIAAAMETAPEDLGLDHRVFALTPMPFLYPTQRGSGLLLSTYTARDTVEFQAAAYLRILDESRFEARSKQFERWSSRMDVIKTWKPSDLGRVKPNILTYESKSDPLPDPSLRRQTTSVEDAIAMVENAEMPVARVELLVKLFGQANLTPHQLELINKHSVNALSSITDGVDREGAAGTVFGEAFDYPVSREAHIEAAKAWLDALSKVNGRQSEIAKQSAQHGQRPDDPVTAGLARIAWELPDYRAEGPMAAPLELYRNLQSLTNLRNQKIDFKLNSLDGRSYQLSDYKGNVVLLNFWATWCPPCIREMPTLDALNKKGAKDLAILAVTDEESKVVSEFMTKGGYSMPILFDPEGKVHDTYGRHGIPHTIVIGRDGKIVKQFYGMASEDELLTDLHAAGLP